MRIKEVKIEKFRGYKDEISIDFDHLTAFIGKNDVGKSTILEALDIFFNNKSACVKFDGESDINKEAYANGEDRAYISVSFDNLPEKLILDSKYETNLSDEYLLNDRGLLEIVQELRIKQNKAKIYIRAYHPTNPNCSDLLFKKNSELKKIISDNNIECSDKTTNAKMRASIWNFYSKNLSLQTIDIDISKFDEKEIWEKLQMYLPVYSLFQADRKNSDTDSEIQDPLQEALKEIFNETELQEILKQITESVRKKLEEVSKRTIDKLREISPEIASSLTPVIPKNNELSWKDVFKKLSITGDANIPINKRGSGVRRLILLSFFRAEAERRNEGKKQSIIYAIEEPETSQHVENQKRIMDSLITISNAPNSQIIITTHNSNIVKKLDYANLRLILKDDKSCKIKKVEPNQLPYPSLNEVNYLAYSEISEEYHNELYGYIHINDWLEAYEENKSKIPYIKKYKNGDKVQNVTLTTYIRHQIHHPENTLNRRFTDEELRMSIEEMRKFISQKKVTLNEEEIEL